MEARRARMEEQGRQPSFNSAGEIRGYRSRPGAPNVSDSGFGVSSLTSGSGGTPQDAWDSFFNKGAKPAQAPISVPPSNVSLAPETPQDASGMASTLSRPYSAASAAPSALYAEAAKSHQGYLQNTGMTEGTKNGVAENIAFKYGGVQGLSDTLRTRVASRSKRTAKLDQSFDSLMEYL